MTPPLDPAQVVEELRDLCSGSRDGVRLMEVCGTHTVNACRGGVHSLMPEAVRLISGPGCPVCVTPRCHVSALVALGSERGATIATYGDLLRVTGTGGSLETARAEGVDVRVVTSSLDALDIAREAPGREVVFAGVGFETTAPATAAAVLAADREGIANISVLSCHKRVVPAMRALLSDPEIRIDGFLCPGHVSVVIGATAYEEIVADFGKPCVVAGFAPEQILEGVAHLTRQVVEGRADTANLYPQVVSAQGNAAALELLDRVFVAAASPWRALGEIPASGLELREEYAGYDARVKFGIELAEEEEPPGCCCGEVLTGRMQPADCALFGRGCTPRDPVGPCMVSSEGSCRAWYRYRQREVRT